MDADARIFANFDVLCRRRMELEFPDFGSKSPLLRDQHRYLFSEKYRAHNPGNMRTPRNFLQDAVVAKLIRGYFFAAVRIYRRSNFSRIDNPTRTRMNLCVLHRYDFVPRRRCLPNFCFRQIVCCKQLKPLFALRSLDPAHSVQDFSNTRATIEMPILW